MDCRTAHLLIEAFHDDELEVMEAASLLAHLEGCRECARRHEAVRRLKQVFRELRPVVTCPEELRRRLASRVEPTRRLRRRVPPSIGIFVVAAGLGLLVGEAVPLRGRAESTPSFGFPTAESTALQRVSGEVFCLRCALERLFPGSSFAGAPHRPVLRTADGRLFTILPGGAEPSLATRGCSGRHVDLLARLDPRNGLARVVAVSLGAATVPTPAISLAHAN